MASNNVYILIKATDQASGKIKDVNTALGNVARETKNQESRLGSLNQRFIAFSGLALGAGAATYKYRDAVTASTDAANRYQNAMTGLITIARHYKQDTNQATKAAQELASDGLMSVTESATGLKNLLASGFSLPQAIKLMERFKDTAAFNRQASLGFGEAIASATEGIKNGNSILVDNAGVTKNLSVILQEAGYSAQDVQKAQSDVNVRMALYNGILKETNPMVGDSKKLAEQFAGQQAKLSTEIENTKRSIGIALQPALSEMLKTVGPIVVAVGEWVKQNPQLTSTLIVTGGALLGLLTTIGLLGTAVSTLTTAFQVLGIRAVAQAGFVAAAWVAKSTLMMVRWVASLGVMGVQSLIAAARMALSGQIAGAGWATGIQAAIGRFGILRALVSSPMVMPAIVVGAALAALQLVINKHRETVREVQRTNEAFAHNRSEAQRTDDKMRALQQQGKISTSQLQSYLRNTQATSEQVKSNLYGGFFGPMNRSIDLLFTRLTGVETAASRAKSASSKAAGGGGGGGGFALGGYTGPGSKYQVAGVVHKGEYVIPREQVNQRTGQPMTGGDTNITISGNITISTPEAANAFFDRIDKTQRLARVGMA